MSPRFQGNIYVYINGHMVTVYPLAYKNESLAEHLNVSRNQRLSVIDTCCLLFCWYLCVFCVFVCCVCVCVCPSVKKSQNYHFNYHHIDIRKKTLHFTIDVKWQTGWQFCISINNRSFALQRSRARKDILVQHFCPRSGVYSKLQWHHVSPYTLGWLLIEAFGAIDSDGFDKYSSHFYEILNTLKANMFLWSLWRIHFDGYLLIQIIQ